MANNLLSQISSHQLRRILDIREQIEKLENELASIAGGASSAPAPAAQAVAKKKRGRPAATRSSSSKPKAAAKGGKRELSPESRAKMAEAMRRRWAVKKGKKS